jgi:hypothetical protein
MSTQLHVALDRSTHRGRAALSMPVEAIASQLAGAPGGDVRLHADLLTRSRNEKRRPEVELPLPLEARLHPPQRARLAMWDAAIAHLSVMPSPA